MSNQKSTITKFGAISENKEGDLHFMDFIIDCKGNTENLHQEEIILEAVIGRLQNELKEYRQGEDQTALTKDESCATCELHDGKYCLEFSIFVPETHGCRKWRQDNV